MDTDYDKTPDFSVLLSENVFKGDVGLISDILAEFGIRKEKIDTSVIESLVKEENITEKTITIIEALWTKWHQSGDTYDNHFALQR